MNVLHFQVANTYIYKGHGHTFHNKDVAEFVSEYLPDRLFDEIPGRSHKAFPEYTYSMSSINNPAKVKKKLMKYAKKLDNQRKLIAEVSLINTKEADINKTHDVYYYK